MKTWPRLGSLAGALVLLVSGQVRGADHLDALDLLDKPAADINDVYAFTNGENLVLAMTVNRFANITTLGMVGGNTEFDPEVLYSFHIDNTDPLDGVAEHTIDIQFNQKGGSFAAASYIRIAGLPSLNSGNPTPLLLVGDSATVSDVQVFAGLRDDPFFFDLAWFFDVPDTHPLAGVVNGDDEDFYHNIFLDPDLMNVDPTDTFAGANVSIIVLEFPAADILKGATTSTIGVWATTSMVPGGA